MRVIARGYSYLVLLMFAAGALIGGWLAAVGQDAGGVLLLFQ